MTIIPINFKHRCVQDLAWVIQSPPLISGEINDAHWWNNEWFAAEFQACYPRLLELDEQPTPLLEAITSTKSKRLGHYFETLVAYWLEISPKFELLLKSHQLKIPEKTLGEIDFLIRNKTTGRHIHLEVSVKFYLGVGDLNDMSNWHGPGLHDRLDRKFNHLRDHQTQLAVKYPNLIPCDIDETACMMKGRLFYPPHTQPNTSFANNGHSFGHWYQLPEIPFATAEAIQLEKHWWMAELSTFSQPEVTRLSSILSKPLTFVNLEQRLEQERFFLLPEYFWEQLGKTN